MKRPWKGLSALALAAGWLLGAVLPAAGQSAPRRILVTLAAPGEPLTAPELDLRVAKKPAEVLRVYQPEERPVQLALLIDDSTGPEVAQSLPALAAFIRSLPAGSAVMVAYLRRGNLDLVQPFTADLESAAAAVRAPSQNPDNAPADLGQLITDALDRFPQPPAGRAQIVYVGGAVGELDPYNSVTLNRAIHRAQQVGIAVWVIHMGTVPRPIGPEPQPPAGEATLQRLSQETGGKGLALGLHAPALDPYVSQLRALLDRQCLVEFAVPLDKKGAPVEGPLTLTVRNRKVNLLYAPR